MLKLTGRLPLLLVLWPMNGIADVRLSPCFTSNMVIQREVPTRLTGWAEEGEVVRVKIGDRVVAETVGRGSQSTWMVTIPAFPAGKVPDITLEGSNSITLTNLLAGELWVCSGQSNMEMTMAAGPWCTYGGVVNEAKEISEADFPEIRLFTSGAKGGWMACTPETVKAFSATAYFFGRRLHQELNVPVGLAVAAAGGTPAEYWTPRAAREAAPGYAEELARAKEVLGGELKRLFDSERRAVNGWRKAVAVARENGTPEPPRPDRLLTIEQEESVTTAIHTVSAGSGYEARVKPLTAMTVKGVIWYQGESNVPRTDQYADLIKLLISGWRADWHRPELPFLIMQLVNFRGGPGWPALRAAQQAVVDAVPDTAIAVGIDIGDPRDIHPKNKQEVGRRLALVALNKVYGQDLVASGPRVTGVRLRESAVVLSLDPGGVGQGLVLNGGGGFELAGADGLFQPASAVLEGDTIVVQADSVGSPGAVRYAWEDNPDATLYNTAGLPAAPFLRPVANPVADFQHTNFRSTPHGHDYHVVR